jgi:ribosomal protein S12 methylthiotransferase
MNVGFISLGCSKNLVDTEIAIGIFKNKKYNIVNNPKEADIIVINTCGFIESAKEEAINTILEMAEYKKHKCKYLIAMGCLVERYKSELEKSLPEVDLFIKFSDYNEFEHEIDKLIKNETCEEKKDFNRLDNYLDKVITTGTKTAYLRIAEGCSNRCTYCAIPYIRGPLVSRKIEDIIEEAKSLASQGYEEIIVIAQDTTKYGIDLYGKTRLAELLNEISKIDGIRWIRFLYAYPETITDELIQLVKENKKICKYFDIPLQHISNSVLKRMNRKSNSRSIHELIEKIKKEIPEAILRTSLIVGFPGETQENFEELYDFVKETKFDRLGVFMYSKEDGTPAEKLPNQIHGNTKKSRYNKIMNLQQQISRQNLEKRIGNTYETLVENKTFDNKYWIGRTKMDIPEMDGVIYIKNDNKQDLINKFVNCKITDIKDYDLIGELVV